MVIKAMITVGVIAQQHGVPIHRVEYIIRSRKIRPQSMAGNARVFSKAQATRIAAEIHAIDEVSEKLA